MNNNFKKAMTELNLLNESFNFYTYANIPFEEQKKAQAEFKQQDKEGILDYDTFHRAYDGAIIEYISPNWLDRLFNNKGELANRGVYGIIKNIDIYWLQAALKKLWALTFVPDVKAERQNYMKQKKAEKQQQEEDDIKLDQEYQDLLKQAEMQNKKIEDLIKPYVSRVEFTVIAELKQKFHADILNRYTDYCKKYYNKDNVIINKFRNCFKFELSSEGEIVVKLLTHENNFDNTFKFKEVKTDIEIAEKNKITTSKTTSKSVALPQPVVFLELDSNISGIVKEQLPEIIEYCVKVIHDTVYYVDQVLGVPEGQERLW